MPVLRNHRAVRPVPSATHVRIYAAHRLHPRDRVPSGAVPLGKSVRTTQPAPLAAYIASPLPAMPGVSLHRPTISAGPFRSALMSQNGGGGGRVGGASSPPHLTEPPVPGDVDAWMRLAKEKIQAFEATYQPHIDELAYRLTVMRDTPMNAWGENLQWIDRFVTDDLVVFEADFRTFHENLHAAGEFAAPAWRLTRAVLHDIIVPHAKKLKLLLMAAVRDQDEARALAKVAESIDVFAPPSRSLRHMAHRAKALFADDIALKGVSVMAYGVDGVHLAAHLNTDLLAKIVQNLLKNGIDYIDLGKNQYLVSLAFDKRSGYLVYQDNGLGMEPEFVRTLAESRVQVRGPRGRAARPDGTGIGWTVIKRNAAALGWTFHIDSEPGVGTTITFVPKMGDLEQVVR